MPDQVDAGEPLDQARCLLVQRAQTFILDFPPTEELIEHKLAVAIYEDLRFRRIFTSSLRKPLESPDQGEVLRLIVGHAVSIVLTLMTNQHIIQRDLVTAISLAWISERSAIEHDVERSRMRSPNAWLIDWPGR